MQMYISSFCVLCSATSLALSVPALHRHDPLLSPHKIMFGEGGKEGGKEGGSEGGEHSEEIDRGKEGEELGRVGGGGG